MSIDLKNQALIHREAESAPIMAVLQDLMGGIIAVFRWPRKCGTSLLAPISGQILLAQQLLDPGGILGRERWLGGASQ